MHVCLPDTHLYACVPSNPDFQVVEASRWPDDEQQQYRVYNTVAGLDTVPTCAYLELES